MHLVNKKTDANKKSKNKKDNKGKKKNKKVEESVENEDPEDTDVDEEEKEEEVKLYDRKDYMEIFANSLAKYTKDENEKNNNKTRYKKYNELSSYNYSKLDVKYCRSLVYRFDLLKPENKSLFIRGREVTKFLLEGIKKWLDSDSNIPSLKQIYDNLNAFNNYIKSTNNEILSSNSKSLKDQFDTVINKCNEISNVNYTNKINESLEILKKDDDNIINGNQDILENINIIFTLLQNEKSEYTKFVLNLKDNLEQSCKKYFYNAKVNIYRPANKGLLQIVKNKISDTLKSLTNQLNLITKKNNEIQNKIDEISNICKKISTKIVPGELKAYTDEKLENFITKKEFEERMLRPLSGNEVLEGDVSLESFDPYDVSLMDVKTNLIYTNISSFVYDYLTVCLIIPGKCFESGVQRIVCYLKFKDMINYLNDCADAYHISYENEATGINLSKVIELKLKLDEVEIIKFGGKDVKDLYKDVSNNEYGASDRIKQEIRRSKNKVETV